MDPLYLQTQSLIISVWISQRGHCGHFWPSKSLSRGTTQTSWMLDFLLCTLSTRQSLGQPKMPEGNTHHSPLGNYQWSPWLLRGKQSYWPTTFPRYLHFRRECFHIQMTNKYMKRKCKLKPQCNNTTLPPERLQWKRLTVIWWGCGTVGARDGNWHNHFGQLCDYLLK